MGRFICKLGGMYFEWSTVVDAPITEGGTLKEFKQYYREQYGESGMRDLPDRLERVEAKGTSAYDYPSVEAVIACNRAGPKETHLSKAKLIRLLRGE